jgi:hypothetical protein
VQYVAAQNGRKYSANYPSCNTNLGGIGTETKGMHVEPWLEHHFYAVLQLSRVESAHRTAGLREGIVGFADVDAVE